MHHLEGTRTRSPDTKVQYQVVTMDDNANIDAKQPNHTSLKGKWNRFLQREVNDVKTYHFWRSSLTEFYASIWLVMFLTGAACRRPDQDPPSRLLTAVTIAFTVNMMVLTTFGLSGAQVNPAITTMLTFTRRNTVCRGAVFFTLQCLGGACGVLIVKNLFPESMTQNISVIKPADDVTVGQAFGIEVILGIIIGYATLSMIEPRRTDVWGNLPHGFGLLMSSNYLFADIVTPICMNPAFSVGPMIALGDAEYQWIYTFGPITGLIIGGFLYDGVFNYDTSDRWDEKIFKRKAKRQNVNGNERHERKEVKSRDAPPIELFTRDSNI